MLDVSLRCTGKHEAHDVRDRCFHTAYRRDRVDVRSQFDVENVGQDGQLQSEPVRPVCFIEAPQLRSLDARRKLVEKINAAVADAYEGIANTREILILHNEYPLENAAWAGRLQSDNPDVVEAMKQLNG